MKKIPNFKTKPIVNNTLKKNKYVVFLVPKGRAPAPHNLVAGKETAFYWAGNMIYMELFECKCVWSTNTDNAL